MYLFTRDPTSETLKLTQFKVQLPLVADREFSLSSVARPGEGRWHCHSRLTFREDIAQANAAADKGERHRGLTGEEHTTDRTRLLGRETVPLSSSRRRAEVWFSAN